MRLILAALLLAAGAAQAEMTSSPRPEPRPAALAGAAPVDLAPGVVAGPTRRPAPRPAALLPLPQALPVAELAAVPPALTAPLRRPVPRPATMQPLPQAGAMVAEAAVPAPSGGPVRRPLPRPAGLAPAVAEALPQLVVAPAPPGMPRPKPRPGVLVASAPAPEEAAPDEPKRGGLARLFGKGAAKKPVVTDGYVCGDPDIRGDELAPITSKVKSCGIAEPVRVTSVDGIRLRGGATIDCTTAKALKTWINKGMRPAFQKEVVELQIAGSYVCRPRNNIRGNKISEHGKGKAVDISAFIFANGTEWTVKDDYNRQIRKAHKAACGIFGTTLGPGSDGYHEDHLHFDTAGYRNGPYCR